MNRHSIRCSALLLLATIFLTAHSPAQFKSDLDHQPSSSQTLLNQGQDQNSGMSSLFGILNSDNFSMHHSFSMNYLASGEGGLSLASYTNSMFYRIADPLNVRFDVTLMGSPFGSYAGYQQNDFSKVFISRAELNYQPWKNTSIRLEYNQLPFNRYYYYDRFAPSPFLTGEQ